LGKRDRLRVTRPETSGDLGTQGGERNPPLNINRRRTPHDDQDSPSTDAMPPEIEEAGCVKTMLSFESLLKLDQ
jgi:hypothetical protein